MQVVLNTISYFADKDLKRAMRGFWMDNTQMWAKKYRKRTLCSFVCLHVIYDNKTGVYSTAALSVNHCG